MRFSEPRVSVVGIADGDTLTARCATDQGATIARVQCNGNDASREQLRVGMAWAFTLYPTDATFLPIA
jgi:hypothetical protein